MFTPVLRFQTYPEDSFYDSSLDYFVLQAFYLAKDCVQMAESYVSMLNN